MVEHVAIQDADRHEVKHASTAANKQVLTANGDGTTQFSFVDYNNLTNIPVPVGYIPILFGSSNATVQQPSALDTPYTVEFGPGSATTDATLASNGTVTFHTAGDYFISLFLRLGRTSGVGTAIMLNRLLVNGVQTLNSNGIKLSDADAIIPFSAGVVLTVTPGTIFSTQIARDSAGVNNGGLFRIAPTTLGWNQCPSASIAVSKYIGNN